MSRRQMVYEIERQRVYGGESPNAYFPQIMVEVRIAWPPHLGHEERVLDLLTEVMDRARTHVIAKMEN